MSGFRVRVILVFAFPTHQLKLGEQHINRMNGWTFRSNEGMQPSAVPGGPGGTLWKKSDCNCIP